MSTNNLFVPNHRLRYLYQCGGSTKQETNLSNRSTGSMTNLIRFSIINLFFILPSVAQYPSWNRASRQNFMAPMHLYDGVPVPKKIQYTAPPIETVRPLSNNHYRSRNDLFVTRTTYFTHPVFTSTVRTHKRYHIRKRNRTRTSRITAATQANIIYPAPQQFGIVVNVYEPTEVYTPWPSTTQRPWWETSSSTTTTTISTTTQPFYDRFPKLPSLNNRPPPPTVPRSFTASRIFTYPPTTTSTRTTTPTTTTTATTTESTTSRTSNSML